MTTALGPEQVECPACDAGAYEPCRSLHLDALTVWYPHIERQMLADARAPEV